MRTSLSRRQLVVLAFTAAIVAVFVTSCSSILGFDEYIVGGPETGSPAPGGDAAAPGDGGGQEASCDVDLTAVCYACPPSTTDQFLNSCTTGQCLPFDRSRLTSLLLPDGGLPPIPDGGSN